MKALKGIAGALVVVGALNWGLVGLAEFDLVAAVFGMEFGETNGLTRTVYGLVGLSAIALAAGLVSGRESTGARTARSAA